MADVTLQFSVPEQFAEQVSNYVSEAMRVALKASFTSSILTSVEPLIDQALKEWQEQNGIKPPDSEE